jgi:hypothetical protein
VLRLAPFTEREIRTAVNTTVRLIETAPTKVPPPASSRLPESSKERSVAKGRVIRHGALLGVHPRLANPPLRGQGGSIFSAMMLHIDSRASMAP